ncbi:hypothetical protein [Bacteroides sp.]
MSVASLSPVCGWQYRKCSLEKSVLVRAAASLLEDAERKGFL